MLRITEKDYELFSARESLFSALLILRQIDTLGHIQPETDAKIRQAKLSLKNALKEIQVVIKESNT